MGFSSLGDVFQKLSQASSYKLRQAQTGSNKLRQAQIKKSSPNNFQFVIFSHLKKFDQQILTRWHQIFTKNEKGTYLEHIKYLILDLGTLCAQI